MKPNKFKKQPHEMNELERLKQQVRKLHNAEQHAKAVVEDKKYLEKYLKELREANNILEHKLRSYNYLREQEVMVLASDGVKYLKGEELDKYCEERTRELSMESLLRVATQAKIANMNKAIRNNLFQNNAKETVYEIIEDAYTYQTYSLGYELDNGRK